MLFFFSCGVSISQVIPFTHGTLFLGHPVHFRIDGQDRLYLVFGYCEIQVFSGKWNKNYRQRIVKSSNVRTTVSEFLEKLKTIYNCSK